MMKLRLLLITGILAMLTLQSGAETPDLTSENAALKAEVARLQNEVANLKAQLALGQNPRNLYLQMRPLTLPPNFQKDWPSDAIPRQFNGMTYYLIPVAQP
jgi:hypothetical protein